nr:AAA family ATPase [Pokkaliibacter plantistimulans]
MSDTHPTPAHPVLDLVTRADRAISNEDFSSLLTFYAEDAALVLTDSLTVRGRHAIAEAFVAVARHFNHSLQVTQGPMKVIEGAGTALVLAQTQLRYLDSQGQVKRETREATYVFRFDTTDGWLCVVDNSYGTALLHPPSPLAIIRPQLHGLCGKIASGKSTLAVQLAHQQQAILLEEDRWLATLYPGQINTLSDYVRCAALLKEALRPLMLALLGAGINVVLDIPGNTRNSGHGCPHWRSRQRRSLSCTCRRPKMRSARLAYASAMLRHVMPSRPVRRCLTGSVLISSHQRQIT